MAKRKSTAPIPPFPDTIDRDYFGAWLSGFVDGEGCFSLRHDKRMAGMGAHILRFEICLRADDSEILCLIQSYLQCGNIQRRHKTGASKPQTSYRVDDIASVHNVIIPNFDRYPLLAKKARDYEIWQQAAKLAYRVHLRRRKLITSNGGIYPKWDRLEDKYFAELVVALKQQRAYQSPQIVLPDAPAKGMPPGLFDHLGIE